MSPGQGQVRVSFTALGPTMGQDRAPGARRKHAPAQHTPAPRDAPPAQKASSTCELKAERRSLVLPAARGSSHSTLAYTSPGSAHWVSESPGSWVNTARAKPHTTLGCSLGGWTGQPRGEPWEALVPPLRAPTQLS